MKLVTPSMRFQSSYRDYINELGEEERYPFPLDFEYSNFEGLISKINDFALGRDLPKGYVQSSTFWLVDKDHIVGVTNIRHRLNQAIAHCGGHIGLGIRPSFRGQGLGTLLMRLSIERLQVMGVETIHIHCHKSNLASGNTIKACGGVLESEVKVDGHSIQRYVVE